MPISDSIHKPTLLLDETVVRRNIQRMAGKALAGRTRFRPHFKTHQSLEIAGWFRQAGVNQITVSSVDMAAYFAAGGWDDITIAFSVNPRQLAEIDSLASSIHLELLVESAEAVDLLDRGLRHRVDAWIKVDAGAGRTGLAWNKPEQVLKLAETLRQANHLRLKGLLTHAGNTYSAPDPQAAAGLFAVSAARMNRLRQSLLAAGFEDIQVSVGDTPGCSSTTDFATVNEIRPGNFVFYDAQQLKIGSCQPADLGVALACPLVALHPERGEAVVYGGAIHLSKDTLEWEGERVYGLIAEATADGWGSLIPSGVVARVSQEHGILRLPPAALAHLKLGDLLYVIPAHSCLTAQCLGRYLSLDGHWIEMMRA
jgi:D-serine deaminase-like pyridoxal phosphate-dependent protein